MTAASHLWAPSEFLRILLQLPITLGGRTVLVDVVVVDSSLDFNMLLGYDYAMNVVVSIFFLSHVFSSLTIKALSLLISLHLTITILIRTYFRIPFSMFLLFK